MDYEEIYFSAVRKALGRNPDALPLQVGFRLYHKPLIGMVFIRFLLEEGTDTYTNGRYEGMLSALGMTSGVERFVIRSVVEDAYRIAKREIEEKEDELENA